jgi:hypothetical protein
MYFHLRARYGSLCKQGSVLSCGPSLQREREDREVTPPNNLEEKGSCSVFLKPVFRIIGSFKARGKNQASWEQCRVEK